VLLQYCDFGPEDLPYIAEVNADKFGSFTTGTLIPIIAQEEALGMKPDMFLVLPWHFRNDILARRQDFLGAGGGVVFPLPTVEVRGRGSRARASSAARASTAASAGRTSSDRATGSWESSVMGCRPRAWSGHA